MSVTAWVVGLVSICLLSPASSTAASVKKKSGEVVEGEIKGLIVQRSEITISKKDGKTNYSASYHLTNGNDIAAIDAAGVHRVSNRVAFFSVSQPGEPLDDLDVLEAGTNAPEGSLFGAFTKRGGSVVRIGALTSAAGGVNADTLLGEYRVDPATRKGRIIAALEIATSKSVVSVPLAQIVSFQKPPAQKKQ